MFDGYIFLAICLYDFWNAVKTQAMQDPGGDRGVGGGMQGLMNQF